MPYSYRFFCKTDTMKTFHCLILLLLLCWFVLICYFTPAAAEDRTSFGVHSSIKCIDHEKEALLRFKRGIQSDSCGLLSTWDYTEDCCQWRGIRCSNRTGHVIMLNLRGGYDEFEDPCLEGIVDVSLFSLKHLKYLDLSSNNFEQTIPKFIDSLTNLEYLNLSESFFFREIPPQLGNLSKLSSLDLSSNEALISRSLQWVSHLTLLREIDLSNCNLGEATDWFQTINKHPSLSVLHLDYCFLPSKIIPSSLSYINSSSALRVVSLSVNNLNDTSILQWWFNLSRNGNQFEYLDLSDNSFSGPLPSEFGNMHSLSYLGLSYNSFSGPLPSEFGNMHSLEYLDLSHNSFSGPLPSEFGNMHSLSYLDLSQNSFSGPLPSEFGNLHSLSYLSLSHNQFEGPIPTTFLSPDKSLRVLSPSYNKLHGSLAANNLCNLQSLNLAGNNFTGDLSNVIQTLLTGCASKPVLKNLDLRHNHFWGSIPDTISSFPLLKTLHLKRNQLNGTVTQNHFSNLSRLSELDLSDNSAIVFNINDDWIPPFQLEFVGLRSCKLGPSFPSWLLTQTKISYFDLSNAQISGSVPDEFWTNSLSSSNLHYLNVSRNKIHGVLPNLSITLHNIFRIDLSLNYFEGPIPSFVVANEAELLYLNDNMFSDATNMLCPKNETTLEDLHLSNNLLSGELPDCWMKFNNLMVLHLENNNLSGNIPSSIGTLQDLFILHLENNRFSGELPTSLLNCTSLKILDVGNNSLSGNIPSSIGNAFTDLGLLTLRANKFSGSLPLSLCQLSNLHILDIAINRISGIIPNCIVNFTAMMSVSDDLSFSDASDFGIHNLFIQAYGETAEIMWKREEQSFRGNSIGRVNVIDLSCNELHGKIPNGISKLKGLKSLDLSRNKLSGGIPSNIGQLTSLELLDLSSNHLSGEIPTSLVQVSSLGTLNLSNNNLSGKIPLGTQLQGFDPSSYERNPLLCGAPLQDCPGHEAPPKTINGENTINQQEHGFNDFYLGLCISVVLGFIIGFWGVCGTLVVKRSWRHAFFRFFDDMKDKLYVMVVVHAARVWRKP